MAIAENSRRDTMVKRRIKYFRSAREIDGLPPKVAQTLEDVSKVYAFRANDYYLDLINWDDPYDPIRQLIIPQREELNDWGELDASNEAANTIVQGLQHKYRDTALVLVNNVCGAYCRYCFRKRLFMDSNDEKINDLEAAFEYVEQHPEILNVLLTGGDPMINATSKLARIIERFAKVPHVHVIRLGTKMLAFNPYRFLDDPELMDTLRWVGEQYCSVYVMAHFDHPRELTEPACDAIALLQENGVNVVNQCPLIRGVNDDVQTLAELFTRMTLLGAPQYYLFQGRPTAGNEPYQIPIVAGFELFDAARRRCSGLSRRARFCMSHENGKIEIVGLDEEHIYMRYHRAKDATQESRIMIARRNDQAYWLDQLEIVN